MFSGRWFPLGLVVFGLIVLACRGEEKAPVVPGVTSPERSQEAAPRAERTAQLHPEPDETEPAVPEIDERSSARVEPRSWGTADRDPDNDQVIAPPEAVPDCHGLLERRGVDFAPARLPLRQLVEEVPTCGCHDAVTVRKTPSGIALSPPGVMSCQMALALAGLDALIQELALEHLGEKIRSLQQGGTYSCRKMARFDLVSEHSYGNAIDVRSFLTESGKKVSILSHYGALDATRETLTPRARFLRELASGAYDRDLVSVSLSPYWDALHRDHFHFDMARYRVDGSRPR